MTKKPVTKPDVGDKVALFGGSGLATVLYVSRKRGNVRVLKDTGHETWVGVGNLKVVVV